MSTGATSFKNAKPVHRRLVSQQTSSQCFSRISFLPDRLILRWVSFLFAGRRVDGRMVDRCVVGFRFDDVFFSFFNDVVL
jgi:hypothetical protein